MLHGELSDADDTRTVTLSRKDLSAAKRLLHLLLGIENTAAHNLERPPRTVKTEDTGSSALAARALQEFNNRRRRAETFGPSMFGEAAWDMLLALYIVDAWGQRQTVGSLMSLAGVPKTTAKRWLDFLVDHDLVRREWHPTDRRTAFVRLTAKAREKLDMYYSETFETAV